MQGQWRAEAVIQLPLLSVLRAQVRALVAFLRTRLKSRQREWVGPGMARAARLSHEYLRMRLPQFHQDVAQGTGRTVEELAEVVKLRREHVPLFGALLRAHHRELLALADPRTLTPARALKLMQRVGGLVLEDPLLRQDFTAALTARRAACGPAR